jgi:hypothetical protein
LQAEILILRHQLNVLRRRSPKRVTLSTVDRLVFVGLYRLAPKVLDALAIQPPETVIRWHRADFRAYWRWKSGQRVSRPNIPADIRKLILEMSGANPLSGAPRIHGELLKLGSMLARPQLQNTWRREGGPRRKCAYVQVVENKCVNGTVRQTVIANLGRADDLIAAGTLVSRLSACGMTSRFFCAPQHAQT